MHSIPVSEVHLHISVAPLDSYLPHHGDMFEEKNMHLFEVILFIEAILKEKSSYIAQYPVLRIAQNTTSLTDLFKQTPSQLLWEASSHMLK